MDDFLFNAMRFVSEYKWWLIAIVPFVLAVIVLRSRG